MRIALVTETYPPEVNGVAMTLSRLVTGLSRRGHRVQVIRPRQHVDAKANPTDSQLLVPGLPIPRYPELRFGLPCGHRLRAHWRQHRPDIVHIATEGPLGFSALRVATHLNIPISSSFHTNFHEYSRHYNATMFTGLVLGWLRYIHNRTGCTMAPSGDMVQMLDDAGFNNLRLVDRGVDTELFTPAKRNNQLRAGWGASPDTLVVTCVGRVAAEKNLPLFVRTFEAIKQHRTDALCVVVGDGPARAALEKHHQQVVFAGMQYSEQLAAHYASSDVFLFPSQTETFGNVVLEAMASRLPVVAYDYAAARLHIRHEVNGLTAAFGDENAFIKEAVRLAQQPELAPNIATAARQTALGISWQNVIDRWERALFEVAAQSQNLTAQTTT